MPQGAMARFPGRAVPELQSRAAWLTARLMPLPQWLALLARVDAHADGTDWLHCKEIADDLGLEYNTVGAGHVLGGACMWTCVGLE